MELNIHRLGGSKIDNLRLKPMELTVIPVGISVLMSTEAIEAAMQFVEAFKSSKRVRELARRVGSTSLDRIRDVGFDLYSNPTINFPNHYRIIHSEGSVGFSDDNLVKLSSAFVDTDVEIS